jgi:uncharacterized protein YlaI
MKTKQLSCKEIAKYICSEMEEHVNSPKCRAIKKHLETCANCTAYLDSLKKTVRLYREYPNPKLPGKRRRKLIATLKLNN